MYEIQQSTTAIPLLFYMVATSDHIAGLTGGSPTVTIRKVGGSFASPSGSVTEIANGWYQVAGNATDSNTLGPLLLHATVASGDPCDVCYRIVSYNPQDAVRLGLTALPNAAAEAAGGLYTRGSGAGQITQDTNGRVNSNVTAMSGTTLTARDIGASVLLSTGTGTGQLDFTSGVVKANLAQILGTALTETAGQLAAAFKQWFNVAAPVGTVNSIPNATAGASGGLLIAGSNAATTVNITGNLTGNVSGSVGSVTGAVGSVTGAVGSVTGAVGSVTGAVGSVTSGVTVTTNNDKTGYTASTVSDKTGYSLLLTQALDTSSTGDTVGGALVGARAQAFGKWTLVGTTLTLYAANGSTAVRTFTLDSGSAPTSRT